MDSIDHNFRNYGSIGEVFNSSPYIHATGKLSLRMVCKGLSGKIKIPEWMVEKLRIMHSPLFKRYVEDIYEQKDKGLGLPGQLMHEYFIGVNRLVKGFRHVIGSDLYKEADDRMSDARFITCYFQVVGDYYWTCSRDNALRSLLLKAFEGHVLKMICLESSIFSEVGRIDVEQLSVCDLDKHFDLNKRPRGGIDKFNSEEEFDDAGQEFLNTFSRLSFGELIECVEHYYPKIKEVNDRYLEGRGKVERQSYASELDSRRVLYGCLTLGVFWLASWFSK